MFAGGQMASRMRYHSLGHRSYWNTFIETRNRNNLMNNVQVSTTITTGARITAMVRIFEQISVAGTVVRGDVTGSTLFVLFSLLLGFTRTATTNIYRNFRAAPSDNAPETSEQRADDEEETEKGEGGRHKATRTDTMIVPTGGTWNPV